MKTAIHFLAIAALLSSVLTAAADEAAAPPQYLFVHNAAGLEFIGGKIVMKGVDAKTIFFSDRTERSGKRSVKIS